MNTIFYLSLDVSLVPQTQVTFFFSFLCYSSVVMFEQRVCTSQGLSFCSPLCFTPPWLKSSHWPHHLHVLPGPPHAHCTVLFAQSLKCDFTWFQWAFPPYRSLQWLPGANKRWPSSWPYCDLVSSDLPSPAPQARSSHSHSPTQYFGSFWSLFLEHLHLSVSH